MYICFIDLLFLLKETLAHIKNVSKAENFNLIIFYFANRINSVKNLHNPFISPLRLTNSPSGNSFHENSK